MNYNNDNKNISNNNNNGISGNGNIGASANYNAGIRQPPPPHHQQQQPSSSTTTTTTTSTSTSTSSPIVNKSQQPHRTSSSHSSGHHSSSHRRESSSTSHSSSTQIKDSLNSRESEFSCKLKFHNQLPEIPFEPKFLKIPSDFTRFTQYKTTSLERAYKHPLLTDPQLGITIDLIDPTVYNTPKTPIKVPENDQPLLIPLRQQDIEEKTTSTFKKKSEIRPNVGWLRRTEYLAKSDDNTFGRPSPKKADGGPAGTPNGKNNTNGLQIASIPEQTIADSQLVENTFDICSSDFPFVHPTNPSLKPVSVLPVFPDFELWSNSYTEVTFDSNPLDHDLQLANKAIVKGITDKFVYFITPGGDKDKNKEKDNENLFSDDDEDDDEMSLDGTPYKMQKVLTSDIIQDVHSENYFFTVKQDAVYYNPLKNRVALKKIKSKDDKILVRTKIGRPKSIHYKIRQQTNEELQTKDKVMADLLQEEKVPFSNKKTLLEQ